MSHDLSAGGRLFHTDGPQTEKLLSSYVVLVCGTDNCLRWQTAGDSDRCSQLSVCGDQLGGSELCRG